MMDEIDVFAGARRATYDGIAAHIRDHVEDLSNNGFTLLPNYLDEDRIVRLSSKIDQLYERQVAEFGAENLARINDEGVCRSPFAYDADFIDLMRDPLVLDICRNFFGSVFTLHVQRAVISYPDKKHAAAAWHREPAYQNFTSSVPVAFTVIHLLDGSSEENGGIRILPGSHRYELFPTDGFVRRHQQVVKAPRGSLLIFDSALFHRGGFNIANTVRRSIVQIFSCPLLKQATDIPRGLGGRRPDDPELAMLLGFTTTPDEGDLAYRRRKLGSAGGGYA
jgi:ectoine hydroxylase-related dioxygenase (phytanoyl-CoA dioxygenase family)